MARDKVSQWSPTPASNTDVGGIDIAEGCAPSGINNAIREMMAQIKDMQSGTDGDNFTVGGNLSVLGTTTLTTALPVASGGTGVTTSTGSGSNVLSTSPTLVTPVLGTPTSGTLTNCTGLPIATGVSGLASGVATFLATPSSANLRTVVTDETGSGSLVFATSPTLVTPALGTPSSGTLTSCTGLPLTTGVTGTLPVANGGTGVTTSTGTGSVVLSASPALTGTPTAPTAAGGTNTTQIATTAFVSSSISALGTMSTQNANNVAITGGTITGLSSALPVASGGTGVTTSTGTGSNVLSNSPTLVTPNLGTPSALVGTNITGTANSLNAGIGVNQTWQNPSRSHGTSYQNTTGKPIMVTYGGSSAGKNVWTYLQVSTDNANWITVAAAFTSNDDDINGGCLTTIVPNNTYYRSTGTAWGSAVWAELR